MEIIWFQIKINKKYYKKNAYPFQISAELSNSF